MVYPGCNYADGNDVFATASQWLYSQKSRGGIWQVGCECTAELEEGGSGGVCVKSDYAEETK